MVLLDLSAAFDTVDHSLLLSRLKNYIGIHDTALLWCKSYLSNRPQHVCIGNAISSPVILDYSVPQGSVLGPQWFTVYTQPVRNINKNTIYHTMFTLMTRNFIFHSMPCSLMPILALQRYNCVLRRFDNGCRPIFSN